jgi:carbamoyl-phosphate synthase small subunit
LCIQHLESHDRYPDQPQHHSGDQRVSAPALLALADGSIFRGRSIGVSGSTTGEVVFNTSMTGYQEILSDPSYTRQIVTLTCPHIGNTGTTPEDQESGELAAAGLVIRDLPLLTSNWRSTLSLADYLKRGNTVAIADIDTRRLTRILREKGSQAGCIMAGDGIDEAAALAQARAFPGLQGMDLAKVVSTTEAYQWNEGTLWAPQRAPGERNLARLHVVAYDFGIKRNILRLLADAGCRITVGPETRTWKTGQLLAFKDGGPHLHSVMHEGEHERIVMSYDLSLRYLGQFIPELAPSESVASPGAGQARQGAAGA